MRSVGGNTFLASAVQVDRHTVPLRDVRHGFRLSGVEGRAAVAVVGVLETDCAGTRRVDETKCYEREGRYPTSLGIVAFECRPALIGILGSQEEVDGVLTDRLLTIRQRD